MDEWPMMSRKSDMTTNDILVFGLNPAYQSTLSFQNLSFGEVNRAQRKSNSIGGKGQNFAIACASYGQIEMITVAQIVGGSNGSKCIAFLEEMVYNSRETRTCTTILDMKSGKMTELIEPAASVDACALEKMATLIDELLRSNKLRAIALCGTLPPGVPGSIYTLIANKKPENVIILLDAYQNTECLRSGKIDIVKINAEEARIVSQNSSPDIIEVGLSIFETYRISILAITNGPQSAFLFEKNGTSISVCEFKIPPLENPYFLGLRNPRIRKNSRTLPEDTGEAVGYESFYINPLGAGDTCSAVFTIEYLHSKDSVHSFAKGLAAASASCLCTEASGQFDVAIQKRVLELLEWKYIK